jgi:hypothetical protein
MLHTTMLSKARQQIHQEAGNFLKPEMDATSIAIARRAVIIV